MDIEIIDDKDNILLGRREVRFSMRFMGPTPDRKVVKEALRAKLGVDPKLVVVGKVSQPFGVQKIEGEARIYKNEEGKGMEHEHILKREAGRKEAEKKEAAPPAPKEGKAEATKEEKKAEAKEAPKESKEGKKHEKKEAADKEKKSDKKE